MSQLLRDAGQFARDFASLGAYAGQTVRIRRYTSASGGGAAWAGAGETRTYTERPVTFQSLRVASTKEIDASGGRVQTGDLMALVPAALGGFGQQDRIVVDGQEYEVAGQPQAETLAGVRYRTAVLRRSGQ